MKHLFDKWVIGGLVTGIGILVLNYTFDAEKYFRNRDYERPESARVVESRELSLIPEVIGLSDKYRGRCPDVPRIESLDIAYRIWSQEFLEENSWNPDAKDKFDVAEERMKRARMLDTHRSSCSRFLANLYAENAINDMANAYKLQRIATTEKTE